MSIEIFISLVPLIEKFQPDLDFIISIAIMIAIKILIQIIQGSIFIFQSDRDFVFSIAP